MSCALNMSSGKMVIVPSTNEGTTMRGLLLGMLFCMAAGAEDAITWIPEGPLTIQQMVFFGLIAGTVGTVTGCAIWDIPNAKLLARHAIANLGLSQIGGATATAAIAWTLKVDATFLVVAPVYGAFGVCGSVVIEAVWPKIKELLQKRAEREAARILNNDIDTER